MDERTIKAIAETMRKARDLPRSHANFFNWHNKEPKEMAICSKFIRYLINEHGESFNSIAPGGDPPDCVAKSDGQEIAIEIVELVDQQAIESQIHFKDTYQDQDAWTTSKLMGRINDIIQKKDNPSGKNQLKQVYPRYIMLIHTDEPELTASNFDSLFDETNVKLTELVNEAYLLFSYDPTIEGYPVRRIL